MTVFIAACALALPDAIPTRLVVMPAGDIVRGRDGRAWSAKDKAAILAQLTRPVLLDENHASVHAAPKGGASPAVGWLTDFRFTDEGLDAAVEWTPFGTDLFSKKAYRYLSPALTWDKAGASPTVLGTIRGLHSVGLTNDPNLDLPALNSQDLEQMTPEQLQALTASLTAAITGGFEALSSKLTPAAPAKVEEKPAPNANADTIKVAVNAVVDAAVAGGKIAPASKDAYVAMGGETAESLKLLQGVVAGLPQLVATNARTHENKGSDKAELTPAQKKICRDLNITEDQFRAEKGELAD